MLIGAHVSTAGGYSEAVRRVHEIGGNCLQIFSTSPRGWRVANLSSEEIQKFKKACVQYKISSVYFHASYLINLVGSSEIQQKSINSLVSELKTAGKVGVRGTVVHLGSFKDGKKNINSDVSFRERDRYKLLLKNIKIVLDKTPKETFLIIENMGMRKIGMDLAEIAYIIKNIKNPRLKVCLDTCHLHAAGFDLSNKKKIDNFLLGFEKMIGLENLEVIHINDSRDELGALRDRHDNINEGFVNKEVFRLILNHRKIKKLPFIAEVPGFDNQGADKRNIDRLKKLIKS